MTEQETVSAAILTMLERLSWETKYDVVRQAGGHFAPNRKWELKPSHDECRFCGVPHAYPHAADCQIKALGALLGIEIENPNSKPGDESYEDACTRQEEANRAYAAHKLAMPPVKTIQMQIGDGDDMDDPFSDH